MMGIPMVGWVLGTLGWYARDILGPGPRGPQPAQAPQQQPQPQAWGPPQAYGPPSGPPSGYVPPYAAPPPPPVQRRRYCPIPLDPHIDERTDMAVARALQLGDARTLRGFAQSIAPHYPLAATVLRTRAWAVEQASAPAQAPAAPPPGFPVPPSPAGPFPAARPPQAQQAAEPQGPSAAEAANYEALLRDMHAQGGPAAAAAQAAPPPPPVTQPVAAAPVRSVVASPQPQAAPDYNMVNGAAGPVGAPSGAPSAASAVEG